MTGQPGGCPSGACTCGCCAGVTSVTPYRIANRPGLPAISYRAGTHGQFKRSMIAGLTSSSRPALSDLGTRADDDFTIALIDAWAVAADVLTFYQERIANESFLPTATERFSLLELGRLTGYKLRPGVAASTHVAFTLESAPGSPVSLTIEPGVKIQSVPGPEESPQTFETVEAIEARPAWNELTALQSVPQTVDRSTRRLYLQGTDTQLKAGDAVLIVGQERIDDTASERWDFRILNAVLPDVERDRTLISWRDPLGTNFPVVVDPAADAPRLFVLRQRAALFGHNAPDPRVLNLPTGSTLATGDTWTGFTLDASNIDLDAVYPAIVPGGWAALVVPAYRELCHVDEVSSLSRAAFAMSGKVTRIVPDHLENSAEFDLRQTTVFAQSEELQMIEKPITVPVYGDEIALGQLEPDLKPGQPIAAVGPRQHIRIAASGQSLELLDDAGTSAPVLPGEILEVLTPPVWASGAATQDPIPLDDLAEALDGKNPKQIKWKLRNATGFEGTIGADPEQIELVRGGKKAATVQELLFIDSPPDSVDVVDGRTTLRLRKGFVNCFDREAVRFNANVAPVTHGETVREVMGQGDASRTFQRFPLKQPPLTHIGATNPQGYQSTLEVRVNDLLWTEVPSLFNSKSQDRVYVLSQADDGVTTVEFGDGTTGARLPTGVENVRAKYRKGIGNAGLVKSGQLSQLMTRPLGVTGAINPEPAGGAADPETALEAREQAPLSVRTLERAVSLQDYEDFARTFIGISKAQATWVWDGRVRRILVTVAGVDGADIVEGSDLFTRLVASLSSAGDPFVPFTLSSYRDATFAIEVKIKVNEPIFLREDVVDAVTTKLNDRFSFEARSFGQSVALSEVYATIHEAPGVVAADIDTFSRLPLTGATKVATLLPADPAHLDESGNLIGAELLTFDSGSSKYKVMS